MTLEFVFVHNTFLGMGKDTGPSPAPTRAQWSDFTSADLLDPGFSHMFTTEDAFRQFESFFGTRYANPINRINRINPINPLTLLPHFPS